MTPVTVRDLRNNSASVHARVAQGEDLTITKDGERLRADIDAIVDQSL